MLTVATVATDPNHYRFLGYLQASCDHFGIPLRVLGVGRDFPEHSAKDGMMIEGIADLADDDLLFFCDAYDTFFARSIDTLLDEYRAFERPVVFSTEKRCWPIEELSAQYPPLQSSSPWKHLNGGGFIGRVGVIRSLYREKPDLGSYSWSSQAGWTYRYLRHPELIALDRECRIFQTLAHVIIREDMSYEDGRWKNKVTGTYPIHVHINGSSRRRFFKIAGDWVPWRTNLDS